MENEVIINGLYKHFKGNYYVVNSISVHTETEEKLVNYHKLDDENNIYSRPYEMFTSEVDKNKYPSVKQRERFKLIGHLEDSETDKHISKNFVYFSKCRENAIIPTRKPGNSGFDIYICIDKPLTIHPHQTVLLPTGIKSIIPEGYGMEIRERGSSGSRGIKYSAGVIDSSFRGEWFLAAYNSNDYPVTFLNLDDYDFFEYKGTKGKIEIIYDQMGDKTLFYPTSKALFQACIYSVHPEITVKVCDEEYIDKCVTDRGDGKLGSSGK